MLPGLLTAGHSSCVTVLEDLTVNADFASEVIVQK